VTAVAGWSRLELRIGRRLTAAEQHIAVEEIDRLLNTAKDELEQEIQAEQARVARAIARRQGGRAVLQATPEMRRILRDLRAAGRAHALAELSSMGYPVPGRAYEQPPDWWAGILDSRLADVTVRVHAEAVGLDFGTIAQQAIIRALRRVKGARFAAADLVSPVFVSGLADTFEQHADLVTAWQYTAVNDSGLCDVCAPWDGHVFASLDALFEVLPDFGPNPECLGGRRCRCRAVPVPA